MKIHKTKRKWGGRLLSIGKVAEPVENDDVVTKNYLETKVPKLD